MTTTEKVKTQPQTTTPRNPYAPIDREAHEERKKALAKKQKEHQPFLRKCLDPEFAAQNEARKPVYQYRVRCSFDRKNSKGKMEQIDESATVLAQNEADAWAKFCDKIEAWPSPHVCERMIKKLESELRRN